MKEIRELKENGYALWVDGGQIHYEQIVEKQIDADKINTLLIQIKNHKQEVIEYLQKENPWQVRLRSKRLNEDIFLVSDNKEKLKVEALHPGFIVYVKDEILTLRELTPDEIKKIHICKKHFGGHIGRG